MKQLNSIEEIEKELEKTVWKINRKISIDKGLWWSGSLDSHVSIRLGDKAK